MVKVYSISPDGTQGNAWSKEFCNGPHVSHTGEIGGVKIVKEEAVSSGTRRIRFTLSG
jgi:alanyl-tRNA synthetase